MSVSCHSPARNSAEIIPLNKGASRLHCIAALKAQGRAGYLIDIGDRYILAYRQPEAGEYLRIDPTGR